MASTILGLFDSAAQATTVKSKLVSLGIESSDIDMQSQPGEVSGASATVSQSKSFWEELKSMFGAGDESQYADYYAEGTRRGATLLTVNTADDLADQAADLMRQQGAINVDERATEWQKDGWTGGASALGTSAAGATVPGKVQVAQEQLEVGKRQVARGGVRILKRVVNTPVEADVNLREERVNVSRRPVGRDLTTAEADAAFADKTMELTEIGEEAISSKSARLVEEVVVDKDVVERTEKVRDTVRKTDVKVERIPGQTASSQSSSSELEDAPTSSRKTADRL